jgi:hypothetical protein
VPLAERGARRPDLLYERIRLARGWILAPWCDRHIPDPKRVSLAALAAKRQMCLPGVACEGSKRLMGCDCNGSKAFKFWRSAKVLSPDKRCVKL